MSDLSSTCWPGPNTETGSDLRWRAESLLSVVAPMLQAMQDAQSGSVESARQLYVARQIFRECIESLCRSLSAAETQDLLVLTVTSLCERLVDCNAHGHA